MHTTIIGGGISGLASGMLLASHGFQVVILEQNEEIGGKCSFIQDENQAFKFDLGPDILINPFVIEDLFWQCGLNLHNYIDLMLLEPQYQIVFNDGYCLNPSQNLDRYEANIKEIAPNDVSGLRKFMNDNNKKFENLYPLMRTGLHPASQWLNLKTMTSLRYLTPINLWKHLDKYFTDHRIKAGFSLLGRYIGTGPMYCPSMYSILTYLELNSGVYYIKGGLRQLTRAMKEAFIQLGGDIKCNCEVTQIKVKNRQATGVILNNGENINSRHVIVSSDFQCSMEKLLTEPDKKLVNKSNGSKRQYSHSYVIFYLGLDTINTHLMHHSIYLPENYLEYFRLIHRGKLPRELMYRVHNPSVTDNSLAPSGNSVIKILIPVPNLQSDIEWNDILLRQLQNKMLEDLAKKCKIPNLAKNIQFQQIITPEHWNNINNSYGASHALMANYSQTLFNHPNNSQISIKNLSITGESTYPGSGIYQVCESAKRTVYALLEKEGRTAPRLINPPISN